jgi:hypothetical protein
MDVLASAAILEAMDISATDSGGMEAGAPDGNVEHANMLCAAANVSTMEKDNEAVRQRGSHPEVPAF